MSLPADRRSLMPIRVGLRVHAAFIRRAESNASRLTPDASGALSDAPAITLRMPLMLRPLPAPYARRAAAIDRLIAHKRDAQHAMMQTARRRRYTRYSSRRAPMRRFHENQIATPRGRAKRHEHRRLLARPTVPARHRRIVWREAMARLWRCSSPGTAEFCYADKTQVRMALTHRFMLLSRYSSSAFALILTPIDISFMLCHAIPYAPSMPRVSEARGSAARRDYARSAPRGVYAPAAACGSRVPSVCTRRGECHERREMMRDGVMRVSAVRMRAQYGE